MRKKSLLKSFLALVMAGAMCLGLALPAAAETAATIQVTETQGTVSVTNSRGRSLTLSENMRLYNGYQVTTKESSYAWLNLDDSKLAKEDAASVVEVRKDGKKLELLVSSGNLYFNVTKPLDSDESLNIRTSSMVTGVRGTCGWVESVDSGHTQVYVLEGTLECQVTDPVSGQSKTATLHSGEVGNFYVYSQAQNGEYCAITTESFSEDAISGFVLKELAGDSALCGKIQSASGLNVRAAAGNAQARLAADEAAMNQRVDSSNQQAANQAGNVSRNPVWNGEGGSTVEQSASASAEQLGAQLAQAGVSEVTVAASSGVPETFTVDKPLEVPAGKTLTLGDNVNLVVQKGASVNVAGTLHTSGDLTNNGTIDVTSGNTLRIEGQLINAPGSTIDNHANGRIVATGGILNGGTLINRDSARIVSEGIATVRMQSGGTLRFTGGAIVNEGGGYALLQEGTMTPAEARTILASTGSGTFQTKTGNVLGAVNASGVYTTVNPSGYSAQIQSDGYYRVKQGGTASQTSSGGDGGTVYVNSTYTLTFDPNGGSMVSGVPVREGYTFAGWVDSAGQPFGSTASVSSNLTLRATWTQNSEGGGETPPAEKPEYIISFNSNGGSLADGASIPTREGYIFAGWNTSADGSGISLTTLGTITQDVTVYAQWIPDSGSGSGNTPYTITFDGNGSAEYAGSGETPTRSGYTFLGWNTQRDGSGSWLNGSLIVNGDGLTYYAQWRRNDIVPAVYSLTFMVDGSEWNGTGVPAKSGYTFAGWYTGEDGTGTALASGTINANTIYHAKWETATTPQPEYVYPTLTFMADGSEWNEDGVPTKDGYTFAGWYTGENGTGTALTSGKVNGDTTYYAKWETATAPQPSTYSFTFNLNGGSMGANGVPTKSGQVFAGWYTDDALNEPLTTESLNISENTTLYAKWEAAAEPQPSKYSFTFQLNGGSMGTDGVPQKSGYVFAGWCTDETLNEPLTTESLNIDKDTTLYAKWEAAAEPTTPEYTVKFDLNDGGTGTAKMENGVPVRPGYAFKGWSTSSTGTKNEFTGTLNIPDTTTLYAIWEDLPADTSRDLVVFGGILETDYTYPERTGATLIILTDTPLTIKNRDMSTPTADCIMVKNGVNADITLAGVNIKSTTSSAFLIAEGSVGNVSVKLAKGSENKLVSGSHYAGLQKTGTAVQLTIDGDGSLEAVGGEGAAGIGSADNKNYTSRGYYITINGGTVTATGGSDGAGIGGGNGGSGSYITINGGTVKATGGSNAAGIGGGAGQNGDGSGSNITINGGEVTATGGGYGAGIGGGNGGSGSDITINGGTVNAKNTDGLAAAIGGGRGYTDRNGSIRGGSGSKIIINGGTVIAVGGTGIGGGEKGAGTNITINGGRVEATAANTSNVGTSTGAAIGGGSNADGTDITITGGTVIAIANSSGAGIGGGFRSNGENITISGGDVTASGQSSGSYRGSGAGIGGGLDGGDGKKIIISGGTVTATGGMGSAGIGGGYYGDGGSGRNHCLGTSITISGGTVKATGGTATSQGVVYGGAGIGGGAGKYSDGSGSDITISGGEVTATGGSNGAGIGGGSGGEGENITVSGGNITATGDSEKENIGDNSEAWITVEVADGTKRYIATVKGGFNYEGGTINRTEL